MGEGRLRLEIGPSTILFTVLVVIALLLGAYVYVSISKPRWVCEAKGGVWVQGVCYSDL